MDAYQKTSAAMNRAMKTSNETSSRITDSETIRLPRGRQAPTTSVVTPGTLKLSANRAITPARKAAAFFGWPLDSCPRPGMRERQAARRGFRRRDEIVG